MQEKILLVDDDPNILQGYQRMFRAHFRIETAVGGQGALIALANNGPYAVVVSDMRMPGMNGVQFLSRVKMLSPETTRIILTGETGLDTAIDAVNDGNIFQFLAKPCTKETLQRALLSGLEQFHLVRAEKEVLENTLCGIIALLTEVLSLVSPAGFSRAMQAHRHMRRVVAALGLPDSWRLEAAALLSQLGCVTLDSETIDAVHAGHHLPPDAQTRYDSHPKVARALLESIPRLQPVAWIIDHQNRPAPVEGDVSDPERAGLRWGAQLLRATLAFDDLLRKGQSRTEAASRIARQHNDLDTRILQALVETEPESETELRTCTMAQLSAGMVFNQDVYAESVLLVAKGQEVTRTLILKLDNYYHKGEFQAGFQVSVPKTAIGSAIPSPA